MADDQRAARFGLCRTTPTRWHFELATDSYGNCPRCAPTPPVESASRRQRSGTMTKVRVNSRSPPACRGTTHTRRSTGGPTSVCTYLKWVSSTPIYCTAPAAASNSASARCGSTTTSTARRARTCRRQRPGRWPPAAGRDRARAGRTHGAVQPVSASRPAGQDGHQPDQISEGRLQPRTRQRVDRIRAPTGGLDWGPPLNARPRLGETWRSRTQAFATGRVDLAGAHYQVGDFGRPGAVNSPGRPSSSAGSARSTTLPWSRATPTCGTI